MKELQRPRDGQGGLWYRGGRSPSQSCEELSVRSGQPGQSKSGGGGGEAGAAARSSFVSLVPGGVLSRLCGESGKLQGRVKRWGRCRRKLACSCLS